MNEQKETKENNGVDFIAILTGLSIIIFFYGKVCYRGLSRLNYKNLWTYCAPLIWFVISGLLVLKNYAHLRFFHYILGDGLPDGFYYWIASFGKATNTWVLTFGGLSLALFILGIYEIVLCKKYENAVKMIGLKNAQGNEPKVTRVFKIDDERKFLKFQSPGISLDDWKAKQGRLSSALGSYVDLIKVSDDLKSIDVLISKRDLPKVVKYEDVEEFDTKPFTFIVGKGKAGLITKSIRECPHFLMGGSTGMGKSTAFKLMLYSFLKNTPPEQLHLCLLDLKRGVEVSDFKDFPNVEISKTEPEAVATLKAVVKEMKSRYDYLSEKGFKSIDPVRDKKPVLVVAVDEASVIFGISGRSTEKKKMANEARGLCEEIGKLGRASGIHLVLATQRATKTSIDTVTMDNLDARLSFRTRSVSGSTAILGDKSGVKIPDIPGRAIWQKGTLTEKVQVPFIQESNLSVRCNQLSREIKGDLVESKLFSLSKNTTDEKSNLKGSLETKKDE